MKEIWREVTAIGSLVYYDDGTSAFVPGSPPAGQVGAFWGSQLKALQEAENTESGAVVVNSVGAEKAAGLWDNVAAQKEEPPMGTTIMDDIASTIQGAGNAVGSLVQGGVTAAQLAIDPLHPLPGESNAAYFDRLRQLANDPARLASAEVTFNAVEAMKSSTKRAGQIVDSLITPDPYSTPIGLGGADVVGAALTTINNALAGAVNATAGAVGTILGNAGKTGADVVNESARIIGSIPGAVGNAVASSIGAASRLVDQGLVTAGELTGNAKAATKEANPSNVWLLVLLAVAALVLILAVAR